MKTLIFGAGKWGQVLQSYIEKTSQYTLVGFIDNNASGDKIYGHSLYKPSNIHNVDYDKIIIAVGGNSVLTQIKKQLSDLDIPPDKIIGLLEDKELFINAFTQRENKYDEMNDRRVGWLRCFADYVKEENIEGNVAECGVYLGDFAVYINKYFNEKKLLLFDTFDGFPDIDLQAERKLNNAEFISSDFNKELNFSNNSEEIARRKMPYIEKCEFHKGYFPESARGIEDTFCFVNLDMDLYKPMLAGLEFFYPQMSTGGVLLLHDYFSPVLSGVKQAVRDYEKKHITLLSKMPIGDGSSIAIIKS